MFDNTKESDCIIPAEPPVDPRCLDGAFSLANPGVCQVDGALILKPATGFLCQLESIAFRSFEYKEGKETELLTGVRYQSSDDSRFVIGVNNGNGTALTPGTVTITATHTDGRTARAELEVLPGINCCDAIHVVTSLAVDNSRSMTLNFGAGFATRLVFAKDVATKYGGVIYQVAGQPKDDLRVWTVNSLVTDKTSFTNDTAEITAAIAAIDQTQQKTDLLAVLTTIGANLLDTTADRRILVYVGDGEHTIDTDRQAIIDAATIFKQAGGIIVIVGVRASGVGYDLLERIATGGFFLNATPDTTTEIEAQLNYLKDLLCVGKCVETGDEYVNAPQLDYSSFLHWELTRGQVNLLGKNLGEYLDVDGLFVELAGPSPAIMRTISPFSLLSGRNYTISFALAGNQREDIAGMGVKVYVRQVGANDTDPNIFEHVIYPSWDSDLQTYNFNFIAPADLSVRLYFEQLFTTPAPTIGNLIDDIVFKDATTQTTLLTDGFDAENVTYVEPACGPSAARAEIAAPPAPTVDQIFGQVNSVSLSGAGRADMNGTFIRSNQTRFDRVDDYSIRYNSDENRWDAYDGFGVIRYICDASDFPVGPWTTVDSPADDPAPTGALESGGTLLPGGPERYNLGITYVTLEGETEVSPLVEYVAETVEAAFKIISQLPTDPRVIAIRLWRSLGATPVETDLYLLVETPPDQPNYIDAERRADFEARYDSGTTAPVVNTTEVTAGELGTGIYCDLYNCLTEIPGAQSSDADPLPDIESGTNPPVQFISTKEVCTGCPAGFINGGDGTLVPAMTSNTAPSGEAFGDANGGSQGQPYFAFDRVDASGWSAAPFSGSPATGHLGYKFTEAKTVRAYSILTFANLGSPAARPPYSWTFEASNDGSSWTVLDTKTAFTAWLPVASRFSITNATAYLYYRLNISATGLLGNIDPVLQSLAVAEVGLFSDAPLTACATATETSLVNQQDADARATAAATTAAVAKLNCIRQYTSTQSFTASCQYGNGAPATRSATRTSLVSQADADALALADATALANAALNCGNGNNTQKITINDRTGAAPAMATPYPSVKIVSGVVGLVSKVVVLLNRMNAGNYADCAVLLVSPSGNQCYLMGNCMDAAHDPTERIFHIDDAAGSSFPANSRPGIEETYKPTVYVGQIAPFPSPAPPPAGALYPTTLATFIGENPNGAWQLYVLDDTPGGFGYILFGWDLTITVV